MKLLLIAIAGALTACGGAAMQTIQIVNRTNRPIEELYVYPTGQQRGTSRGTLAPSASTTVQVKEGHVSVMAISAKIHIDEHTRDKPSATQELELTSPTELVFYDEGQTPPGIERKGTIGVSFVVPKPAAPPEKTEEPTVEPAPEAP